MNFKRNWAMLATTAAIATATVGCVTTPYKPTQRGQLITQTSYQRPSVQLSTPEHIKGHELRRVTERDSSYSLEEVILHGKRMYVQENVSKQEGELDFTLVLYDDHRRRIDNKTGKLEMTSDSLYIPTLQSGTRTRLRAYGRYALRADMTSFDIANIGAGVARTSQNDAQFQVKTIFVNGKEFYAPIIMASRRKDANSLPFWLIGVDGTIVEIDSKGQIVLENTNGRFRPKKITRKAYEQRTSPPEPIEPEDNLGEEAPNGNN